MNAPPSYRWTARRQTLIALSPWIQIDVHVRCGIYHHLHPRLKTLHAFGHDALAGLQALVHEPRVAYRSVHLDRLLLHGAVRVHHPHDWLAGRIA
jgi:hypothetical protein